MPGPRENGQQAPARRSQRHSVDGSNATTPSEDSFHPDDVIRSVLERSGPTAAMLAEHQMLQEQGGGELDDDEDDDDEDFEEEEDEVEDGRSCRPDDYFSLSFKRLLSFALFKKESLWATTSLHDPSSLQTLTRPPTHAASSLPYPPPTNTYTSIRTVIPYNSKVERSLTRGKVVDTMPLADITDSIDHNLAQGVAEATEDDIDNTMPTPSDAPSDAPSSSPSASTSTSTTN